MKIAFESIPREFVSDTMFFDYKATMGEAAPSISRYGAVVVTKDGEYYGIVDDRAIVRAGALRIEKSFPVGKYAERVKMLNGAVDIQRTIREFYDASTRALPYAENGKVIGVVKRSEILKAVLSLHMVAGMQVREAMSTPIVSVDRHTKIAVAKKIMERKKANRLVVLYEGRLFGILSYKDIIIASMAVRNRASKVKSSKSMTEMEAGDVCEADYHSIMYNDDLDNALRNMVKHNVSSLLVFRDSKPAGVLAIRDVFGAVVGNFKEPAEPNIELSGLDDDTGEYEDEIMDALRELCGKAGRLKGMQINSLWLNVKKVRTRSYEMSARVVLSRHGAISERVSSYGLEQSLKLLTDKVYERIINMKRIQVARKKM